jgi:uncharacterized protein YjbJ (UPF0337 family)
MRHLSCKNRGECRSSKETDEDRRMNLLALRGNWNVIKGRCKQRLARWVDDSTRFSEGQRDELTGRIQKQAVRVRRLAANNRKGRKMELSTFLSRDGKRSGRSGTIKHIRL